MNNEANIFDILLIIVCGDAHKSIEKADPIEAGMSNVKDLA